MFAEIFSVSTIVNIAFLTLIGVMFVYFQGRITLLESTMHHISDTVSSVCSTLQRSGGVAEPGGGRGGGGETSSWALASDDRFRKGDAGGSSEMGESDDEDDYSDCTDDDDSNGSDADTSSVHHSDGDANTTVGAMGGIDIVGLTAGNLNPLFMGMPPIRKTFDATDDAVDDEDGHDAPRPDNYRKWSVGQLRTMLSEHGVNNVAKMKKGELVAAAEAISAGQWTEPDTREIAIGPVTDDAPEDEADGELAEPDEDAGGNISVSVTRLGNEPEEDPIAVSVFPDTPDAP